MPDTRKFCTTFCVKLDTKRTRFELSPAPDHGGPEGKFRVRMNRRWLDSADGGHLYFDRDRLSILFAEAVFGDMPEPAPEPDVPQRARVSVRRMRDGEPYDDGGWTVSPPILGASGRWMVAVNLADGTEFVPVDDCTLGRRRMS